MAENKKSEQAKEWLEGIRAAGRNLTKWELDFVDSIDDQLAGRGSLSERQLEILERIYAERTP